MVLSVSLHQSEVPSVFAEFSAVIGEEHWTELGAHISEKIRSKPHLRHHLSNEYSLVLQLAHCSSRARENGGLLPARLTADPTLYSAFSFAKQSLELARAARKKSGKRARSFIRRVQASFRESYEVHAMQFEAMVATHFRLRGRSVRWPEFEDGPENFDLLIDDAGPRGLEVECKVVTKNKGRRIHREDAIAFFEAVRQHLQKLLASYSGGIALVVTLPARLPNSEVEIHAIARAVYERALTEGSLGHESLFVRVVPFDRLALGRLSDPPTPANRSAVEGITATTNCEMLIFETAAHGIVIVVIQSARRDGPIDEAVDTLRMAAIKQLTSKRPGLLLSQLHGITPGQLTALALKDKDNTEPSPLARGANSILNDPELSHVVGCGFLSSPEMQHRVGVISQSGGTYTFYNRIGHLWDSGLDGLFS